MAKQAGFRCIEPSYKIRVEYDKDAATADVCAMANGYFIRINPDFANLLPTDELAAVMGHEIMHIMMRDTFYQKRFTEITIAISLALLSKILMMKYSKYSQDLMSEFIIDIALAVPSVAIAKLVANADSRRRELRADREAAKQFGCAVALRAFLQRIISIDTGKKTFLQKMNKTLCYYFFETHPTHEVRIAALEKLSFPQT